MNKDDMDKRVDIYLKSLTENVGKEHQRLTDVLIRLGKKYGYVIHNTLPEKIRKALPKILPNKNYPDVTGIQRNHIFIADAKDANSNDRPSNKETLERISSYVKEFAKKTLSENSEGDIAIATNDYDAALEWKDCLEKLCEEYGVTQKPLGTKAKFYVYKIDESTYVITHRVLQGIY